MLKCNYLLICIIFISYFWVFEISIFKNILIYTSMWCSSFRNLRLSFFLSSINWLRDKMIRLRVINVKDIFSMVICTIKLFKPAEKYTIVGNTVSIQGMHWNKQKKIWEANFNWQQRTCTLYCMHFCFIEMCCLYTLFYLKMNVKCIVHWDTM